MRVLHLFVTITLSISTSAYDDSRPQRKDIVPENAVDGLGISNRDLAVVSTSNASDANSLNMNGKRALGDPHLVAPRPTRVENIPLIISGGRFTKDITIDAHHISGLAVLDTGSTTTWIQGTSHKYSPDPSPFHSMGFFELHGGKANGVVTMDEVPAIEMEFRTVQGKTPDHYTGGLALDRSRISWPNYINHDEIYPVFSFHCRDPYHAEFNLGPVSSTLVNQMEWYEFNPKKRQWTLDGARIKVKGISVGGIVSTIMDTGVEYIYGSEKRVAQVYRELGGHYSGGFWMIHCNREQPVTFSWGRTRFPIHDFLVDGGRFEVPKGAKSCKGVIRPHASIPDNTIVLGTGFFYGKRIAFGKSMGIMLTGSP
ncbi:hypothetical protein APHAL10511_007918 [Amanita phalloides]|nr:hypothetical protein APHAL10511_007918 [Amanita phalloides]